VTQAKTENGDAMNDPDNQPPRPADEMALLDALRRGDEQAFLALVTMHYAAMLRLAQMYVGSRAVAEEVIQETWIGVLQGLSRFEGRSSLKTWIFRILLNRARTRAQRENRTIPFSALTSASESDEPAVDPDAFAPPGARYPGGWLTSPAEWDMLPEERLLSRETRQHVDAALTTLPPARYRRLERARGLRLSRHQRGQPAGAAPPGALAGTTCAGGLPAKLSGKAI
jgi:RNA polymerase sigma-70 factor (ECF subfamily)